jgi:hypothetical protein
VFSWQLEDDPGAPPEQAWRRKINSHADTLKEFRVTFMEGFKMVMPLSFYVLISLLSFSHWGRNNELSSCLSGQFTCDSKLQDCFLVCQVQTLRSFFSLAASICFQKLYHMQCSWERNCLVQDFA